MSVILTGAARDRVSSAAGFIEEVTDPSKFLSKMPLRSTDVISDIGEKKTLKQLLESEGNPVYQYKKDGTKQFLEYYKGDYELRLVDYMGSNKSVYNRILSREEALHNLIEEEYGDWDIEQKLALAALDTRSNQEIIKELFGVVDMPMVSKEASNIDVAPYEPTPPPYPQLATNNIDVEPEVKAPLVEKVQKVVFKPYAKAVYTLTTSRYSNVTMERLIDAGSCVVACSLSDIELDSEERGYISNGNTAFNVFYSGLSFADDVTGNVYSIFVKD